MSRVSAKIRRASRRPRPWSSQYPHSCVQKYLRAIGQPLAFSDERMLARRIFPDWSMGYVRIDGGWLEGQYEVADALARDMPKPIRDVLMSMATTLPFE